MPRKLIDQKFEHYLITCFNVNRGFDQGNKRNSSEYLDFRFSLFESVTIPSVEAQSCSNFLWLIFFDIDTPKKYKERIKSVIKSSNFLVFYVNGYEDIKTILKKKLKPETKYLATTNLDNDDAIAQQFIEIVQSKFIEQEVYLLNFMMGYMMSHKGLYMREYYSSPFYTLMEKVSNEIISCISIPHNLLYELGSKGASLYQIVSEPVWLQMVHGTNVRNKIEINAVPISSLETLKKFNLKELPFDLQNSLPNSTNRLNLAFFQLRRKRPNKEKISRSKISRLVFRMKLALYTLEPKISLIYNNFKLLISSNRQLSQHKLSLIEFRELLSNVMRNLS